MEAVIDPRTARNLNMAVPLAVVAVVLIMILPIPPALLDLLISANITLSVITLIVTMYITRPVQFSVYPSLLLLLTLFRLALNITSTRLILLNGNTGTGAAGRVIESFGQFVVGGNYLIGVVIFILLIAIQYVVINHGAVRISEVTARFTLDAMPGKQMSIDSDLNAGLIDESEARTRRQDIAREAEFYGAMDGAVRFTQRDAIASIIITTVNIVAGFLIGVLQHGMALERAIQTYTVLTVGDGLVTVVPALLISVSGGLITTRAAADSRLGTDFSRQLFFQPEPLLICSAVLLVMAAVPGLPGVPFLLLGLSAGGVGWNMRRKIALEATAPSKPAPAAERENLEGLLRVDPVAIEVGLGLVKLVDTAQGGTLLKRIAAVRRQLATELGFLMPPVRVTDNLTLKAREYVVLLKGAEIARFEMRPNCDLAINPGTAKAKLEGVECREPAFGIPAVWIEASQAERARTLGYTVVDPPNILATHLTELIRAYAYELFNRQEAKKLVDRVAAENPRLVEDLVPKAAPLSLVQRVMQALLRERVSIRDGVSILEAVGEAAGLTKNPILLVEYVRQSIARTVVKPYLNDAGELAAFFVDPGIEDTVRASIEHTEVSTRLNLAPAAIREILEKFKKCLGGLQGPGAVISSAEVRFALRQIAESALPQVVFLSHAEIPATVRVISLGMIQ
ncbi:MAG TPA: flagellar biosynthesis protein FlhA [Bryobacterales bacterium]|nr:flagellar biosynthesis protein FlhA [Bryobacterales bacterium]